MTYSTTTEATVAEDKVRENRLRRMAQRQGLTLQKTRRYDPLASDYGTYRLSGKGAPRALLSLDEVERHLTGAGEEAAARVSEAFKPFYERSAKPMVLAGLESALAELRELPALEQEQYDRIKALLAAIDAEAEERS